jgi:hypothetical protein
VRAGEESGVGSLAARRRLTRPRSPGWLSARVVRQGVVLPAGVTVCGRLIVHVRSKRVNESRVQPVDAKGAPVLAALTPLIKGSISASLDARLGSSIMDGLQIVLLVLRGLGRGTPEDNAPGCDGGPRGREARS